MTTENGQTGGTADAATLSTLRSLLSKPSKQLGRALRVLEVCNAESTALTAELSREIPLETVRANSKPAPDVVIIHPQTGLETLVRWLYAVRNDLTADTLLCGPGIDQPGKWPALLIAIEHFIQDYRIEGGIWIALPTGITHLKNLPCFEDIAHLVSQVETDLRAAQIATAQGVTEQPGELTPALIVTAIRLLLDRAGYWKHNRIIWCGAGEEPQALTALVGDLRARLDAAGIRYDPKPFVSHVTLVRDAAGLPAAPAWIPPVWEARDFALVSSMRAEGRVSYQVTQRFAAQAD